MKIEVVVVPAEVDELLIKVGTEDRPPTWEDLHHSRHTIDTLLFGLRHRNSNAGYTDVHMASCRSSLQFTEKMEEIRGESVSKEDLESYLEGIATEAGEDVPLVVIRVGDEENPATEKQISEVLQTKATYAVAVVHDAFRLYRSAS